MQIMTGHCNNFVCICSQHLILGIAAACLQLFLQQNWTGPVLSEIAILQLPGLSGREKDVADALSMDSETAYPLAKDPMLLVLSRVLLLHGKDQLQQCQVQ